MAFDPNEAPEGYFAVKGACKHCVFHNDETCCDCCVPMRRKDKQYVYFVKKPESTKQDSVPTTHSNISLRDFFTGCAISGFMNASEEVYKVPERAYIVADMMLAEREKSFKEEKGEK